MKKAPRLVPFLVTSMIGAFFSGTAMADVARQAAPALPSSRGGTVSVWTGQYVYTFGGWRGSGYDDTDYFDQIVRHDPVTGEVKVSKATLPGQRYLAAAVWDGTYAYIFGGRTSATTYTQIVRYHPATETVTVMGARLPTPIYALSAVYSGRYAYIFGGQSCEAFPCNYVGDVLRYDPQTDTLTNTGADIPARGFTSAAWDGSNAYIFGGYDARTRSSDITRYNPATNTVSKAASLPTGRDDTSAAFDGTHIYVFGGENAGGVFGPITGEIVRFDPANGGVSVMPATIPPRRQTSAVWTGSKFHVFGGYSADIAEYQPASGWAGIPATLPSGGAGVSAVWDGTSAYIFGGVNGSRTNKIQRYDSTTGAVTDVAATLPSARSHTTAVWTGSSALIFGGVTTTPTDEIVSFSPTTGSVATMQARLPLPLYDASAIWDGENTYIIGGRRWAANGNDRIFKYDPVADQIVTMTATLPSPRDGAATVWDGSFIYIFGGYTSGGFTDEVLRYDPATDTISTMSARLPRPSGRFPAVSGVDAIYLFGGAYFTEECYQGTCYNVTTYSDQIFRYRPQSDEMVVADATLPSPRAESAAIRVGNDSLVIGGWDGSTYPTKIVRHRVIPGQPRAFGVDPGPGAGDITLSWQAPSPASYASPITGYRIYVREGGSAMQSVLANLGPNATGFLHTGLPNGAQRYYAVSALNAVGEGEPTKEVGTRAPVPPSAPPSISGGTGPERGSVKLTWGMPANNGGSAITGFRVFRGTTTDNMAAVADVGATTTYVDLGLSPGTYFHFRVAATNAAGPGQPSTTIIVRSSGPPDEPYDVQATPNVGGIRITWALSQWNGGSPITSYRIYRHNGTAPGAYIGSASATSGAYFDSSCRIGSLCYYTVTAVSAFGESDPSNEAFMFGTRV